MSTSNILDCVIIGSGPAGYTAAIYAARADLKPVVYTGMEPGGQLTTTTEVENFPGYPNGITGPELMEDLKKQAERFGTIVHTDYIIKVEFSNEVGGVHKLYTSSEEILTKTVIISTGATAKYLGLPCEKKYQGGGVSACATCDGFFYRNRNVVVVGGGDTAAEEATYLSKLAKKVTMLVRKDEFRASKAMVKKVLETPNIEVLYRHELKDLEGNGVVEKVIVFNNVSGEETHIDADGIFIAIGHKPNTDLFINQIELDETGYIITEKGSSKTNLPGVFAAGDVQDKIYRQAITAAGSGCMSALDTEKYLSHL
jgi:thioredoxin reductase (NADPH)